MGYIKHDAVIVTVADYIFDTDLHRPPALSPPDVAAFVASMPEDLRRLVVGPIPSLANGYRTYLFAPDGSKEGWYASDQADEWRQRFIQLFSATYNDGSSPFNVVAVSYGADQTYDGGARIEYQHPTPDED